MVCASGVTINLWFFHSILPVPVPLVSILLPGDASTTYAGSRLTLSCSIFLNSNLFGILGDLVVISVWSDPGGGMLPSDGRITVSPASYLGATTFTSTVMFNTLRTSDAGNYTCNATVAPRGSTAGTVTNGVRSASRATPTIQSMYVCYLHNMQFWLLQLAATCFAPGSASPHDLWQLA